MAASDRTLTLITGDRVRVSADRQQVYTIPGPGRSDVRFGIRRAGGHLYVIPSDALVLIGRNRLDYRLFDVTELLSAGYNGQLPVIVTYDGPPTGLPRATAQRYLPAVNGTAARVPTAALPSLFATLTRKSAGGIAKVWLDGRRKLTLDHSVPQIGAPGAWAAGYTGRGVRIAVLDGGVEATHPDLAGRVRSENFTPDGPGDANGHGTHVASIAAGSGAASDGRYRGVAPDAEILSGKVCVARGCAESWILAGMDWAVSQQAKVVNLSLGGPDGPGDDLLEQAINTLTARSGTLFVVAAGNYVQIDSPGSAAAALTVGAVDREDKVADFSGRGPTASGLLKPDVTAPGIGIVAAKSADSQIGEPVGSSYLRLSGTSMATPHVAGAVALLAQQHPSWKADQLKAALMGSAVPAPVVPVLEQGSGRVDASAASRLRVTASAGALSFDLQRWPHTDDVAQSKELVYVNDGPQDVVLELSAAFTAPGGTAAPAGAVRLSASTITVPAHGTASVSVTSDTRHVGPDGLYVGRVVARSAGTALVTRLSVMKERESYDLTIGHLDRSGAVTGDYLDIVVDRDAPEDVWPAIFVSDEDGTTNLRLPKGRYLLDSTIGSDRNADSSMLLQPRLDLTADTVVTLDARMAKPITVSVPDATARSAFVAAEYDLVLSGGGWGGGIASLSATRRIHTAQIGPSVPELSSMVASQLALPDPAGGEFFENTPYVYALAWQRSDGFYTGFSKAVRQGDLATVRPTIAAHRDGTVGVWGIGAESETMLQTLGYGYEYAKLPATPTVYVTTDQVKWAGSLVLREGNAMPRFLDGTPVAYRPGRIHREDWARAVLGPAFPAPRRWGAPWIARIGNVLDLWPVQADRDGHFGRRLSGDGSLTVYRNGSEVATIPYDDQAVSRVEVSPGQADYRIELETASDDVTDLSTAVRTSWTFRSGTPHGTGPVALPMWAVRFQPAVDDHNVLRTGRVHLLPVVAEAQHGSAVGRLTRLTVQISTDDGKSWQSAPVRAVGSAGRYVALVTVPDRASYVSLKARATDSAGNTVDETITRAYRVAGP